MSEFEGSNFNNIIRKIIKKSLFTERQIEIILNQRDLLRTRFPITRGAYYRQVGQSREKLVSFFYTMAVLRGLDILLPEDVDVIMELAAKVDVINRGDVPPGSVNEMIDVIETYVRQACSV